MGEGLAPQPPQNPDLPPQGEPLGSPGQQVDALFTPVDFAELYTNRSHVGERKISASPDAFDAAITREAEADLASGVTPSDITETVAKRNAVPGSSTWTNMLIGANPGDFLSGGAEHRLQEPSGAELEAFQAKQAGEKQLGDSVDAALTEQAPGVTLPSGPQRPNMRSTGFGDVTQHGLQKRLPRQEGPANSRGPLNPGRSKKLNAFTRHWQEKGLIGPDGKFTDEARNMSTNPDPLAEVQRRMQEDFDEAARKAAERVYDGIDKPDTEPTEPNEQQPPEAGEQQ
jgi:hypothetical protein